MAKKKVPTRKTTAAKKKQVVKKKVAPKKRTAASKKVVAAKGAAKKKAVAKKPTPQKRTVVSRTKAQRLKLGVAICNKYKEGRFTIDSVCAAFGVAYRTFACWAMPSVLDYAALDEEQKKITDKSGWLAEVALSYEKAKDRFDEANMDLLKERGRAKLLELIEGNEYEEVKTTEALNKEGKMEVKSTQKTNKRVLPNATAVIFALKNADSDNFMERVKTEHSGAITVNSVKAATDEELDAMIASAEEELDKSITG